MSLLAERHGRHREIGDGAYGRARLLRAGNPRSQLLLERRRRCRNAGKFVTTIALQLAVHVPLVQQHIRDILTKRSIVTSQSLTDQWHQLVFGPLSKLDGNNTYLSYVVVIDALDEYDSETNMRIILRLLTEEQSLKKVRLRVLATSRPEVPIRHSFCQIAKTEHRDSILHDIEAAIVDGIYWTGIESWSWLARRASSQTAGSKCQWPLHLGFNGLSVYPGRKIVRSEETINDARQ